MADEDYPTKTQHLARIVEEDRLETADVVEADRAELAEDVELTRVELARILEEDRKIHNARLAVLWSSRVRAVNRWLWALLGTLVLVFGLMLYRTETNADAIQTGIWEACIARSGTAERYNQGREVLIDLAIHAPDAPSRTEAETTAMVQQLRDGLLLPVEDCGPQP